jgi:hypothetical protein
LRKEPNEAQSKILIPGGFALCETGLSAWAMPLPDKCPGGLTRLGARITLHAIGIAGTGKRFSWLADLTGAHSILKRGRA